MAPPELSPANPHDTELMLKLLSLDVARMLYPFIGLAVEDDAGLVRTIREGLEDKPGDTPELRVERAMSRIRERQGASVFDLVQRWGASAFHHAYRAKHVYGYWIGLLAQCRWQEDCGRRLDLPEPQREAFMAHFLVAQDDRNFDEAYGAAASRLSNWDLEMKAKDAFHDAENEVSAPEILLRSLALVERNKRFWQWVVRSLTPEQLEALYASAKVLASDMQQFVFINELCRPSELARPIGENE